MVLVLLEGIKKGERSGKMPTDLNQTQVNQMSGHGDISVPGTFSGTTERPLRKGT